MATAKKKNTAKKNKKNQGKKNGASPRLSALGVSVILAVCGVLLLILFIAVSPSRSISGVGVLLQAIKNNTAITPADLKLTQAAADEVQQTQLEQGTVKNEYGLDQTYDESYLPE